VFDHIVINARAEDHLSYEKIGVMDELRKSLLWVPAYEQVEMIKKMRDVQIAKNLKIKNVDPEIIAATTGLSLDEIAKL
jgi:hypothetical protein